MVRIDIKEVWNKARGREITGEYSTNPILDSLATEINTALETLEKRIISLEEKLKEKEKV